MDVAGLSGIYAGVNVDSDTHYWDQGLFGFEPGDTPVATFASQPLNYDFVNQYGTAPVWVYIELNKNQTGDIIYQYVPTTDPSGYHTENAGSGAHWQAWTDLDSGIPTGAMMSLSDIAAANPGKTVSRVYLTEGMGDSYHTGGPSGVMANGTVAWVDTVTIGTTTYDFAVNNAGTAPMTGTIVAPTVTVTAPGAYVWTLFKVGGNWSNDDTGSVVVTENSANTTNWQVVAQDVSATDYGFMRDGSSNALATKFEISKANANSGLTYAINGITYTGTDNGSFDFYGYQNVTNGDAAGTYSITITFTATVTSYN